MTRLLATAFTALALLAAPAYAASDNPSAPPTHDKEKSKQKQDQQSKWQQDYRAALALIEAREFEKALAVLAAMDDGTSASVLNNIGYAYGQLGHVEEASRYYEAALKLDPDHKGVHEYYGELKVRIGYYDAAKAHLKKLEQICGTGCEEYAELKKVLEDAGQGGQ